LYFGFFRFFRNVLRKKILFNLIGYAWKVARCPICGQPLGWIWKPVENLEEKNQEPESKKSGFFSLRLDKVLDPGSRFLGPAIELPEILKSIWNKIG
jgi:hypothetical protein